MLYIITAMTPEAKPVIRYFQMKKRTELTHFPIFQGGESVLVISGTGAVRCTVAVSHLLTLFPPKEGDLVVNIGVCGSCGDFGRGELVIPHTLVDMFSGRSFYPDMLYRHPFSEGVLGSFAKPVSAEEPAMNSLTGAPVCTEKTEERRFIKQENPRLDIADMEGAFFYQAAVHFLYSHRITSVKIVSDHLKPSSVTAGEVETLVSERMPLIGSWMQGIHSRSGSAEQDSSYVFTEAEEAVLQKIITQMRLSAAMADTLKRDARRVKVRHSGQGTALMELLAPFETVGCHTREERGKIAGELARRLME